MRQRPPSLLQPATRRDRGCPDGVDLNIDASACTIPLDAPDASVLYWEASSVQVAHDLDREPDGTYVMPNAPAREYLTVEGFEPVDHDYYMFDGAEHGDGVPSGNPWEPGMVLEPGETHSFSIYSWNGADGPNPTEESTLEITFRGCPAGVNPEIVADPSAECTIPIDAPESSYIELDDTDAFPVAGSPRLDDGTYVLEALTAPSAAVFYGFAPTEDDSFHLMGIDGMAPHRGPYVSLDPEGEHQVFVYYYNEA